MKRDYRRIAPGVFKLNDSWIDTITPGTLEPLTQATQAQSNLMGIEVHALAFEDGGIVWIEDPTCTPTGKDRSGAYVIGEWALDQIANAIEGFPQPKSATRHGLELSAQERALLYVAWAVSDDWEGTLLNQRF